ncbi:unnamed protein product, partial [Brassica rapa subsp. narinosa]
MNLYPDRFQVPQERLLSLVADVLFDNDDDEFTENQQQRIADAVNLLPRLADGINVNIRFRRIDDFEYGNELYNLVTDQGYLNERDLVWEKLNEVNGDSVFVDGDFKVFKCE